MSIDHEPTSLASSAPVLRRLPPPVPRPRAAWLGLAAAALLALGTVLPWAEITVLGTEEGVSGTSTNDGRLVLGAAVLAAVLAVVAATARRAVWLYALVSVGIGAGAACLFNLADIRSVGDELAAAGPLSRIAPGPGLWLSLAAAGALVAAGLLAAVEARRSSRR